MVGRGQMEMVMVTEKKIAFIQPVVSIHDLAMTGDFSLKFV